MNLRTVNGVVFAVNIITHLIQLLHMATRYFGNIILILCVQKVIRHVHENKKMSFSLYNAKLLQYDRIWRCI